MKLLCWPISRFVQSEKQRYIFLRNIIMWLLKFNSVDIIEEYEAGEKV